MPQSGWGKLRLHSALAQVHEMAAQGVIGVHLLWLRTASTPLPPGAGPAVEDQLAVTVAAGRRSHRARSSKTPEGVCRRRRGLRANGFAEGNVQVVAIDCF